MALENPPIKKKEGYPSKEELDYWIEQIQAGKDVDYFFERIVVCMTPYFRFLARSFARSTNKNRYEDYMQEGYILIWKILNNRSFNAFFPYTGKSFYYELTKKYHQHMRSQLAKYYYMLETGKKIPWDPGYTQRLFEYQERRKERNHQIYLRRKARQEELRDKKQQSHEKYLHNREKHLAYAAANRERRREYYRQYYQANKAIINKKNRKWYKKNKDKSREYSRKYREAHPERFAENQKRYKENHPNAARDSQRRYRERHPRPLKIPGSKLQAPYGFRKGRNKVWILNREQSKIVQKIFEWYITGKGANRIIKLLKEQRIPSPSGNETWATQVVTHIIKDVRYTGRLIVKPGSAFGKNLDEEVILENYFPRIISDEDFNLAQEERKRRTYK